MKLKGSWAAGTTYDVGDVVRYTNGDVCILQKPCKAGITPLETAFWGRADNVTTAIVNIAMDAIEMAGGDALALLEDDLTQSTAGKKALDAHQGKVLKELIDAIVVPTNISDDAITLKDESDNEYLITVDASGDTPELVVTAITNESAGT